VSTSSKPGTATPETPVRTPPEPRPTRRAGLSGSSVGGLVAKLVLLGVINALGVYGLITLSLNQSWQGFAAMLVGVVVADYVYLSKRTLPLKYLYPGLAFLLVYQVYVVLYTGVTAFTNYGDGHNNDKQTAISTILSSNENRVPDSPTYRLSVLSKGGTLSFLVTDPKGQALIGSADDPLHPADVAKKDDSGKAVSVVGYHTLTFAEILQRQQDVTTMRVPFEDPNAGSLRTTDGSTAYVYRSTLKYDQARNVIVDTAKGTVYRDNGKGYFVGPNGQPLQPGWQVFVGADNFTRILTDTDVRGPFVSVLVWTFAVAILSVLTTFALGLLLAIVLNDERMRGRRVYRSILLLPYAIPAFMSALIWAGLLNTDFGFVNEVLLGGANIPWLSDPWLARFSVIFVNLWLGFPYMFLVCTGALQAIPGELIEAARVDGASAWRVFRSVKLPLLLVALAPLLIASFAFNFNNFNLIYMLTGGGPKDLGAKVDVGATDILISFVYKIAFGGMDRQYGFACAVSILIFVIIATISAISFRKTRALEELS
jgi:arabinogalactan oligomer/maltooligosaccharide transport system permease protein